MTKEEALAEFTRLTDGSLGDADNFFALEPDEQAQALSNYAHMNWTKDADVGAEILAVLGVLAQVGVDVTGFAGAFAALKAV